VQPSWRGEPAVTGWPRYCAGLDVWRANRGRVHRSDRYTQSQQDAGWELKAQRPGRVEGAVEVSIALGRPDNRKRDLDNAGKAVMDLLVAHQVIEDDSQVMRISSGWDLTVPPGRAMIIVKSAMAAETIAS
jgi:crossover junction endodeoxyribonuclease RusA